MATRATIKIKGFKTCKLYKHYDGYPSATLPWPQQFAKDFVENRGFDVQYMFAQLLRSSSKDAEKFDLDASLYTGWGVVPVDADCGEDYQYTICEDGSVLVGGPSKY